MKHFIILFFFIATTLLAAAQEKPAKAPEPDKTKEVLQVEAACGQCIFGLGGKDCDLAVKLNGKAYFVDGSHIDSHGDAHAEDGFCNAVRKAKVQGEVVNNRFKATYFQLLPEQKTEPKKKEKQQ